MRELLRRCRLKTHRWPEERKLALAQDEALRLADDELATLRESISSLGSRSHPAEASDHSTGEGDHAAADLAGSDFPYKPDAEGWAVDWPDPGAAKMVGTTHFWRNKLTGEVRPDGGSRRPTGGEEWERMDVEAGSAPGAEFNPHAQHFWRNVETGEVRERHPRTGRRPEGGGGWGRISTEDWVPPPASRRRPRRRRGARGVGDVSDAESQGGSFGGSLDLSGLSAIGRGDEGDTDEDVDLMSPREEEGLEDEGLALRQSVAEARALRGKVKGLLAKQSGIGSSKERMRGVSQSADGLRAGLDKSQRDAQRYARRSFERPGRGERGPFVFDPKTGGVWSR